MVRLRLNNEIGLTFENFAKKWDKFKGFAIAKANVIRTPYGNRLHDWVRANDDDRLMEAKMNGIPSKQWVIDQFLARFRNRPVDYVLRDPTIRAIDDFLKWYDGTAEGTKLPNLIDELLLPPAPRSYP